MRLPVRSQLGAFKDQGGSGGVGIRVVPQGPLPGFADSGAEYVEDFPLGTQAFVSPPGIPLKCFRAPEDPALQSTGRLLHRPTYPR